MNRIWAFLRGLDWRVLLSLPALAALLGIANNLRVSSDLRVRWSGERPEIANDAEATEGEAESAHPGNTNGANTVVERGVWTSDFVAATKAAEAAHLPVVVAAISPECPVCVRFQGEIDNEEVRAWQKKLGWYFVMANSSKDKKTLKYVRSTPIRNKKPPHVGVYWLRPDGTRTMRNFSAQSGLMGVPAENSLVQEWMHAIEASVPGAPGVSFVPEQGPGVQICAKTEFQMLGKGLVRMEPKTDVILPGEKVILTAKPNHNSEFAGWRYPDGRIVNGGPQLTLDDQCQAGEYRAIFRRVKKSKKSATPKSDGEEK